MVSSPARMGARPNLRRRILSTTLLSAASAAASAVFGGGTGRPRLLLGVFGFEDGAGLGFGDGFFGLCGGCWRSAVSSQSDEVDCRR